MPLEYEFAVRNRDRLKAGWLVTCGGCFNYVTGDYARAPRWMQTAGLEWLHRLWREPQEVVLALCRHQSACAFSALDAHERVFPGNARAAPDGGGPQRGLKDRPWPGP